jgi:hypothetical protein
MSEESHLNLPSRIHESQVEPIDGKKYSYLYEKEFEKIAKAQIGEHHVYWDKVFEKALSEPMPKHLL